MPHDRKQSRLHKRVRSDGQLLVLREALFAGLHKLEDLDTLPTGVQEVEAIAGTLAPDRTAEFLSLLLDHRHKQTAYSRRAVAGLIGSACWALRDRLSDFGARLVANLGLRLKDPDHTVREAVAAAFGQLAAWVPMAAPEGKTPLSRVFKALFTALVQPSADLQHAASLAIRAVVQQAPRRVADPAEFDKFKPRLLQAIEQSAAEAVPGLVGAIGEMFGSMPTATLTPHREELVDAVLEGLSKNEWQTRAAAVEALTTLGLRQRVGIQPLLPRIVPGLQRCRRDPARPVRDAALQALQVFEQLEPSANPTDQDNSEITVEPPKPAAQLGSAPGRGVPGGSPGGLDWDLPFAIRRPASSFCPTVYRAAEPIERPTAKQPSRLGGLSMESRSSSARAKHPRLRPNPKFFKSTAELYSSHRPETRPSSTSAPSSHEDCIRDEQSPELLGGRAASGKLSMDQLTQRTMEVDCQQLLAAGDDLQLVRALNRWSPEQAVDRLTDQTASELLTRLAQLVSDGQLAESCAPWLGPLLGSDKTSEQARAGLLQALGGLTTEQRLIKAQLKQSLQRYQLRRSQALS